MKINIRHFYFEKMTEILNENIMSKEVSTALVVRTREGLLMQKMKNEFKVLKFKGIDISEKCIENCKRKELDVEVGDVNTLASSEKFDLIYGSAILHHLDDIEAFFKKTRTALKNGGVVLIEAEPVFYEFFYILYHMVRSSWAAEKD